MVLTGQKTGPSPPRHHLALLETPPSCSVCPRRASSPAAALGEHYRMGTAMHDTGLDRALGVPLSPKLISVTDSIREHAIRCARSHLATHSSWLPRLSSHVPARASPMVDAPILWYKMFLVSTFSMRVLFPLSAGPSPNHRPCFHLTTCCCSLQTAVAVAQKHHHALCPCLVSPADDFHNQSDVAFFVLGYCTIALAVLPRPLLRGQS